MERKCLGLKGPRNEKLSCKVQTQKTNFTQFTVGGKTLFGAIISEYDFLHFGFSSLALAADCNF